MCIRDRVYGVTSFGAQVEADPLQGYREPRLVRADGRSEVLVRAVACGTFTTAIEQSTHTGGDAAFCDRPRLC